MRTRSKAAAIYLSLAFAAGLPCCACYIYAQVATLGPRDSEGLGFLLVFAMFFAFLAGVPLALIGTYKAARNGVLGWPNYLALFLGANIPAIASGCMYPVLTMIPALQQLHEPTFDIAMAVGTLLIYFIIAVFAATALSCKRPQQNAPAK